MNNIYRGKRLTAWWNGMKKNKNNGGIVTIVPFTQKMCIIREKVAKLAKIIYNNLKINGSKNA